VTEAIRRVGRPGFDAVLMALFHGIVAPDNLITLAYLAAGRPRVLFHRVFPADHAFGRDDLHRLSGCGVSLNLCLGRDAASGQASSTAELMIGQHLSPVIVVLAKRHWSGLAAATGPADDVTRGLIGALADQGVEITPRQAEVALMIQRGHSTPSIGLGAGLSLRTVKVFRRQLHARFRLPRQAELFALMLPLLRAG
jgi:DNA-binding CsgD family transcriptional regulator